MGASRKPIFSPRADWMRVVEAIGAPVADDPSWARAVLDAGAPAFRSQAGFALYVIEDDPERPPWSVPLCVSIGGAAGLDLSPGTLAPLAQDVAAAQELFNAFHYESGIVGTQEEFRRGTSKAAQDFIARFRKHYGHVDALGMVAHPEPGCVLTLTSGLAEETILSPHERKVLSRIALHLESAYRLRKRPEAIRAILTPGGKLVHREGEDLGADRLAERVSRIERSRTRSTRRQPEALDLWDAMVEGEASIVERVEGGKRYYVVLDNPPSRRKHRALTHREAQVVRMAARGLPTKLIAYGLGITSPSVSNALTSAAAKLGLADRNRLIQAASLLLDTPGRAVDAAALTDSEREIFELVRRGLSNDEIAQRRSRSVRTVANQIGSILRKTSSSTRRALLAAKQEG